ncbi:putative acetyltransferase EpsM [compost metagenome]
MIHPSAIVASTARIGEGVVICPFSLVSDGVKIDDFAMLNYYASCGHDAEIGAYSILSPYATVNGMSCLEDEVFMGTHSTVTARRRVGHRAKINANSVAMQDVAPRCLVIGVPGKSHAIFV